MTSAVTLYNSTTDTLLMQADALGAHIPSSDRRMLIARCSTPLSAMPPKELTRAAGVILEFSMRDMGISRPPDEYDGTRFVDILVQHFPDFTIDEVKEAFERFSLGDLDPYLPTDSRGKTIDHYQQFSMRFYVKVLRAYRAKQQDVRQQVSGKVANAQRMKAVEERNPAADRAEFLCVLKQIVLSIASEEPQPYILTDEAEYLLWRAKLLPAEFAITDEDRGKAKWLLKRRKDAAVGIAIEKVLEAQGWHPDVEMRARGIAVRRLLNEGIRALGETPEERCAEVTKRFDWLIERWREKAKKA